MRAQGLCYIYVIIPSLILSAGAAGAGPVALVPAAGRGGDVPLALMAELAQRCPARLLPFRSVAPLLPRLSRLEATWPPPVVLPDAPGELSRSEDWLGRAAQLQRIAASLEDNPVALLASSEWRQRLHQAWLYASQALLMANRRDEARRVLARAATRLPDLPLPGAAHWGPSMGALAEEVARTLPPALHTLVVEGPVGWAVHVDEQPLGPLPGQQSRLRPGPHAVVAVGPEGQRASWRLELPLTPGPPVRLLVNEQLKQVCPVGELAGLCAETSPMTGAAALAALLDSDVILLQRVGDEVLAWRVHPSQGPGLSARVALHAGERPVSALVALLCPPPLPAPQVAIRHPAPRRFPMWPGTVLASAGAAMILGAAPLFAYQGRCVDEDCALIYDFRGLPAGLAGAGAGIGLGGVLWLALALRR
ncbi:MAG: hypothetical protein RMK29_15430 [Myxococcales bacterium]|nr:hypothetical protein [Myxococcales bacterium]